MFTRSGVFVYRAEGDSYFWVDQARLLAAVYPYVTDATRDYMQMVVQEQRQPFTEHEVITISFDSLAARMKRVDELILRHDSTIVAPKLRVLRSHFLDGYLTGFANTSVFDTANVLRTDVRESYERLVADSPRSFSGGVVRRYLELLRASDYRRTDAITDFPKRFVH
jgi:hypothetical protein